MSYACCLYAPGNSHQTTRDGKERHSSSGKSNKTDFSKMLQGTSSSGRQKISDKQLGIYYQNAINATKSQQQIVADSQNFVPTITIEEVEAKKNPVRNNQQQKSMQQKNYKNKRGAVVIAFANTAFDDDNLDKFADKNWNKR